MSEINILTANLFCNHPECGFSRPIKCPNALTVTEAVYLDKLRLPESQLSTEAVKSLHHLLGETIECPTHGRLRLQYHVTWTKTSQNVFFMDKDGQVIPAEVLL